MYPLPQNRYGLPNLTSLELLSAPEIGMRLLQIWRKDSQIKVPSNFARDVADDGYSGPDKIRAALIFMEGLSYLIREGLIIRDPGQSSDFYTLSRTGRAIADEKSPETGIPRSIDAREILHPLIAGLAIPEVERGRQYFVDAIFKAFRQVEITVRDRSGLELYGVPLMRAAFGKGGPLFESQIDLSEAEALGHLLWCWTESKRAPDHLECQAVDKGFHLVHNLLGI